MKISYGNMNKAAISDYGWNAYFDDSFDELRRHLSAEFSEDPLSIAYFVELNEHDNQLGDESKEFDNADELVDVLKDKNFYKVDVWFSRPR